ncbi:MAG: hypothetical protein JWN15_1757, partial [Firmicutes bacterium]|nr:hypothetical protein [Bacillota bacterium]
MTGQAGATGGTPVGTPVDLDAHVREIIDWHFAPATGSAYWLRRAATL